MSSAITPTRCSDCEYWGGECGCEKGIADDEVCRMTAETERARIDTNDRGVPLWILYRGVIQCFECGWWVEADNEVLGVEIWKKHFCMEGFYD